MTMSVFLAKFFGLWFIFAGVAWLYRKEAVSKLFDTLQKDSAASAVSASINLIVGLLVVLLHNWWGGWITIITLIGWVSLIKGLLHMFRPAFGARIFKAFYEGQRAYATGIIVLLIGVFLTYQGFYA